MPRTLKIFVAGLVTIGAFALVGTSLAFGAHPGWVLGVRTNIAIGGTSESAVIAGVLFWTVVTLFASALPVTLPRGTVVSVGIAPIVATMILGGPVAAAWVTFVGTTELRELRGRVPWYGTLFNHAGVLVPAVLGSLVIEVVGPGSDPAATFVATMLGSAVLFGLNVLITTTGVALRDGLDARAVLVGDTRAQAANLFALAPIGWLMSQIYMIRDGAGVWATLLFGLPLYMTRLTYSRLVEMREMFTQTIGALAEAVDKRDPFTARHSHRVKEIASDIGRVMHLNSGEMEALEWGGLLHDVGKIGVPDHVLLKPDRLTREERMLMNSHPVLGAQIIAPVTKLAPELPIIRHHHEWYNGSGYPDRLLGEEIPKLARVLHVADAFEAMTAARPYRMKPLTTEQALGELRKFAGIQFDPEIVDAFVKTGWVDGVPDPGRAIEPRPVPMLAAAAGLMTHATTLTDGGNETPAAPVPFAVAPEVTPRAIDAG